MPVRSSCWWCIPSCTSPPEPFRSPRIQWSQIPALGGVWGIENRLHWVRDVTFDEDRSHDYRPDEVVKEIGSGLNGNRRQLRRFIGDPSVGTIIVEHRERLCRFGFEYIEAALSARAARILVVDDGEVEDDLVRDATEVMTSLCARLYGKRSARRRAERAVAAAGEL